MKKNSTFKKFLLALMLVLSSSSIFATHGQGGDITYEYVSPNVYKVRLTLFRDCHGVNFGTTNSVNIKSASGAFNQNYTLNMVGTAVDITPLCPSQTSHCADNSSPNDGVQQFLFESTITLPASRTDYIISFSLCCRNNSITTLTNPGSQNIYIEAALNSFITNSSPVFHNSPVAFVCNGQQINYNHGVSDADGDELVFSLVPALRAAGTAVTYAAGFSGTQPLNTTGAFTIDPATGAISYTPNGIQTAVVGVKVEEYRLVGGIRTKIGEVLRDMQFSIEDCSVASGGGTANNAPPTVSGINGTANSSGVTGAYTITVPYGVLLNFNLAAYDAVTTNLNLTWNNGIAGATFTPDGTGTSATFSWTPTINDGGTNFFTVTVKDDNCPILGISVYTFTVIVVVPVSATCPGNINQVAVNCTNKQVTYTSSATGSPAPTVTYVFTGATTGSGNGDGSGSVFNVGTTTVQLTATDGGGLTANCSFDITIATTVTFTALTDLCIDAGIQTGLGNGTSAGGIYSGLGVTDNGNGTTYSFDPATAGVGTHTITYTKCGNTATDDVEVFALPTVTFTAIADLCLNDGTQTGLGGGTATGGVYSGSGITDDGNGMTYSFDPATAGAGVHTITYSFTNANGCNNSATDDVEVFALPTVTFTAIADLCLNDGTQTGLGGGTATGGVYSGSGITDDGNGMTYSFDPATAGAGVHTITYSFTNANGCNNSATDNIEVFGLPAVTFTAPADLCIDAGVQAGLGGGTATGGVYSGSGVTDDGNGMTYSFDPATAGVGVHTITYSFTNANGCNNSATDNIEVFGTVNNTISQTTPGILTANQTGATYQWYTCPNTILTGETNQNYTPTATGDYKVVVTVGACVGTSTCTTVSTLGAASFDDVNFKYYPNPTSTILNIEYSKTIESISVINLIGQQLLKNNTNSMNVQVDLSILQAGTYFVKVNSDGKTKLIKVVKQ